ncbi:hypothetical protein AV530_015357 [Patagioenas fasciata monilis]|uniref:Uncharacterized protein n=1 Tax=Patagioenas fasciata monilis TaxID=372326 RepID=A0A1V4KPS5_PATFA|nr:hypothetical protein AV530_015357 [Patagioenas fasciata monilis]
MPLFAASPPAPPTRCWGLASSYFFPFWTATHSALFPHRPLSADSFPPAEASPRWKRLAEKVAQPKLQSGCEGTSSTQPPSSRATPLRKGRRFSSAVSAPPPGTVPAVAPPGVEAGSSVPVLKEEYIQISLSLRGKDQ